MTAGRSQIWLYCIKTLVAANIWISSQSISIKKVWIGLFILITDSDTSLHQSYYVPAVLLEEVTASVLLYELGFLQNQAFRSVSSRLNNAVNSDRQLVEGWHHWRQREIHLCEDEALGKSWLLYFQNVPKKEWSHNFYACLVKKKKKGDFYSVFFFRFMTQVTNCLVWCSRLQNELNMQWLPWIP